MKKATEKNITDFLNKTLSVRKIRDSSVNGLQVRSRARTEIRKVGFAVDACMPTFEKAKKEGVELLVVHHGIKWKPQKDRVLAGKRTAYLRKNTIGLYAAHLPLDLHKKYGNNIRLAEALELGNSRKFGQYHGVKIGLAGTLKAPMKLSSIRQALSGYLQSPCSMFRFGKEPIRTVGIISGGGGSMLSQAVEEHLDCFVVGEIDLAVYNAAKDYGMNLVLGGHYATETVGVKALMPLVAGAFDVETVFIEDKKRL